MGQLVSDSQMASLRSVAKLGMQSDVTILHRTAADDPYGDDSTPTWTETVTVKGWVRGAVAGDIRQAGAMTGLAAGYRLFVPVDTPVTNGDRVRIEGNDFTVQDTNIESTWRVVMRCELERVE